MYDQVYWMLTSGGAKHVDPVSLRPEMMPVRRSRRRDLEGIRLDGPACGLGGRAAGHHSADERRSSGTSARGLRAPSRSRRPSCSRITTRVDRYIDNMRHETGKRLDAVYDGLSAMQRDGLPVECVRPEGAIYVSARFALHGMRTPDGTMIESDEDVRRYLLNAVGFAAIPFNAFGSPERRRMVPPLDRRRVGRTDRGGASASCVARSKRSSRRSHRDRSRSLR